MLFFPSCRLVTVTLVLVSLLEIACFSFPLLTGATFVFIFAGEVFTVTDSTTGLSLLLPFS